MILAGIDIGTNTIRLLVLEAAGGTFRELYSGRKITRLGQDIDRTGRFSPDAEERSLRALSDFSASIQRYGADHIAVVGTSAFRIASNAQKFIEEVEKRTGLVIRVISGEEEARFTLIGVMQVLKNTSLWRGSLNTPALVIDIGGGSTEIIMTSSNNGLLIKSLPLGAVYLTERFIKHDPPLLDEIQHLRTWVQTLLQQKCPEMLDDHSGLFVGTAGTITTLAAIDQKLAEYDPDKINGYIMSKETVSMITNRLCTSTLEERRTMPGLEQGREDIIPAGSLIVQEIMDYFGVQSMMVSDWGLREGIIFDLYARIHEAPSLL